MTRSSLVLLAFFVTGCSTPQQRFSENISSYQEMCSRMGYQAGSEQMANCIRSLYGHDEQNAANASSQRKAAASALGQALLTQPQYPAIQPVQTCRWIGPNWVCQ